MRYPSPPFAISPPHPPPGRPSLGPTAQVILGGEGAEEKSSLGYTRIPGGGGRPSLGDRLDSPLGDRRA